MRLCNTTYIFTEPLFRHKKAGADKRVPKGKREETYVYAKKMHASHEILEYGRNIFSRSVTAFWRLENCYKF